MLQILNNHSWLNASKSFENHTDLGLSIINRRKGTGYHTPKGILFAYGPNQERFFSKKNKKINTLEIAPTLLDIFKVKIPEYMLNPLTNNQMSF